MIDFENPTYLKLRPVQDSKLDRLVAPLLCPGEEIVQTFQSVRDGVVFTTRRVIARQCAGGHRDEESLHRPALPAHPGLRHRVGRPGRPGRRAAAVVLGLGTVRFELLAGSDLAALCQAIECGM